MAGMMRHLFDFPHGFGDAVQFTVVLRHLAHYYPRATFDVRARPGCETLFGGLAGRALTLPDDERAADSDRPMIDASEYASMQSIPWPEPVTTWADSPSTKAEHFLRDALRLRPIETLCRYQIQVDDEPRDRARAYLRRQCAADAADRFPVVLVHYQGNSARAWKNLDERAVRRLCRELRRAGLLPLVLDWNGRSGLVGREGFVNAGHDERLWTRRGLADGATLAALIGGARLMVGIDSGPGHVAGATDTPTLIAWTRHHPVQFYGRSPNVTHLVRQRHTESIRGDRGPGLRYFHANFRHAIYRKLADDLPRAALALLDDVRGSGDGRSRLETAVDHSVVAGGVRMHADASPPVPPMHTLAARRLAVCSACDQLVGRRCTMTGIDIRRAARQPATRCPMARWPEEPPPPPEPDALRGDLNGRALLLRFPHGLGDHVQLTGVLAHLRWKYPAAAIDVACRAGAEALFAGLCRRVVRLGTEDPAAYDLAATLRWPEPNAAYADSPSTKAQRALREVFGLTPLPEFCRYFVRPAAHAQRRAEEFFERVSLESRPLESRPLESRPLESRLQAAGVRHGRVNAGLQHGRVNAGLQRNELEPTRFPVVLFHVRGRCGQRLKNLDPAVLAACVRAVLDAGHVPVLLDWPERGGRHIDFEGAVNAAADRRLWSPDEPLAPGRQAGHSASLAGRFDAGVIAALAARARLCVGIDSGPGHLFAAVDTPTIIVWRLLHPVNYFGLADNVTHWVPKLHGRFIRGRRTSGEAYFRGHYRHHEYADLLHELPAAIKRFLHCDECTTETRRHGEARTD
jgi:ADP-heptose:LPS heptosyltransferase